MSFYVVQRLNDAGTIWVPVTRKARLTREDALRFINHMRGVLDRNGVTGVRYRIRKIRS